MDNLVEFKKKLLLEIYIDWLIILIAHTDYNFTREDMLETLKPILAIQNIDIKLIRLKRIELERQKELHQIEELRKELQEQLKDKEKEIAEYGKTIVVMEQKIQDVLTKSKKLEGQQSNIKKVDEFNALTQEMTSLEREKINLEQKLSDIVDKKVFEEELLEKIKESLESSEESSKALEKEIQNGIALIDEETKALKIERDELVPDAETDVLQIYERLLRNKKDRVFVPIENRTCSGCHIVLTAQHENMVRKGTNLVFCEHCSRVLYWQESEALEGTTSATKRRRRRTPTA